MAVLSAREIEERTEALLSPICEELQCSVVDIEWLKLRHDAYLRVYIEAEAPVDHILCGKVSHALSEALDTADFIEDAYFLEISSPGIERPLKKPQDFASYAGRKVKIKLYAPQDGQKEFLGCLLGLDENGVSLIEESSKQKFSFPLTAVAKANLVLEL